MTFQRIGIALQVLGPIFAVVILLLFWGSELSLFGVIIVSIVLLGGVASAVGHVDTIAAYVGRVPGAIILALAVTIIEVTLIIGILLASGESAAGLGRDTVFAAVMITTNGIIGISVVAATLRSPTSSFNSEGSGAALGAIAVVSTLALVLPTFTTGSSGPTFTDPQLVFVAISALAVYSLFIWVLTLRNKEHFEDPDAPTQKPLREKPSKLSFLASLFLLVLSLSIIVALSQVLSPSVETAVVGAGLPLTFVAVAIALVILLPEGASAFRYAQRGQLQSSFNIGYGSALASIGLTIPTLALVSLLIDYDLEFGLKTTDIVLLLLTLIVSAVTVASHRVTLFQGGLHLVIFGAFIFLSLSP